MNTSPDEFEDFLLSDDDYIARISKRLADEAANRSRHKNRRPGDEIFDGYDDADTDDDEDDFVYLEDEDS